MREHICLISSQIVAACLKLPVSVLLQTSIKTQELLSFFVPNLPSRAFPCLVFKAVVAQVKLLVNDHFVCVNI